LRASFFNNVLKNHADEDSNRGFIGMIAATAFPCVNSAARSRSVLRRRPSPHQGRGLEVLGHAIEYLIDSRTALISEPATKADAEALDILMRLSRCIFFECKEIVPIWRRLKVWVAKGLIRGSAKNLH
jgi:hypothetical protein